MSVSNPAAEPVPSHRDLATTSHARVVQHRVSAIAAHLDPPSSPSSSQLPQTQSQTLHKTMSAQERPPITCHVLDTVKGRPAASIVVTLTLLDPLGPSAPFTGLTNSDGRVTAWQGEAGPSLREIFHNAHQHEGARLTWSLKFDTGSYFGEGNTFFPEVEIRFFTTGLFVFCLIPTFHLQAGGAKEYGVLQFADANDATSGVTQRIGAAK